MTVVQTQQVVSSPLTSTPSPSHPHPPHLHLTSSLLYPSHHPSHPHSLTPGPLTPSHFPTPSQTLDEDVLSHKKDPEELHSKAMNIIKACCEGSGEEILHCSQQLQSRFDALSQVTLESRELCEEATSAMQEFQGEFSSFSRLLEGMEEKLVKRKKKKYPVGTVEA